jgi:hypothetical protein
MVGKHSLPEGVHLAVEDVRPTHPLGSQIKATNAAKK